MLFRSSFYFFLFSFLSLFLRIIYYGFYTIFSIHVWVRCWKSFFSLFSSLSLFLSLFSIPLPFFLSFVLYTMAFLLFPPSTCGSGVESHFFPLLLPFLESSILSCKAACSLFRHHLHINAARRIAGQHLMRRQQYPQIFVISHSYPLFDIFSFILLQDLSEALL